jgi:hypothetical protein
MNQIDVLFWNIFFIVIILLCYFQINYIIKKQISCNKGKIHNLFSNSKGNTGDLGFGIRIEYKSLQMSSCSKENPELH